ncbi:YadA-like family protein [Xanthomonas campestris]|uniref:YadA-like family protein n=1 Tax=Xanthomonas campestris TaxID=339 RepID=UPI002B23E82A|nr:YadA-like family protein [Xanthomonas campestris]MEA9920769.1 YadA-like family protein [Xanthomonas campestris pv. raphani]
MPACRFSILTAVVSAALFASPLYAQTATGSGATASGPNATATGEQSQASGPNSTATGAYATATGNGALATGVQANASGDNAQASGTNAQASGQNSVAIGQAANAAAVSTIAIGTSSFAGGEDAVAVGAQAVATGVKSLAQGVQAQASGDLSMSLGYFSRSRGNASIAQGSSAEANADHAVAIGTSAVADAFQSLALGVGAEARAQDCVALGSHSRCWASDEVSVGSTYEDGGQSTRRITNVRAGTSDTDVANLGQVRQAAQALGGGATFVNGNLVAPIYQFRSGATHQTVGAALDDLDGRVAAVEQSPGSGSGNPGPRGADGLSAYEVALTNGFQGNESDWLASLKGESGAQGPAGNDGVDGTAGTGSGSVAKAGKNIEVTTNADSTQTVSVSDNVQLSDTGSVSVGATTVNAQGVFIQGGPSVTTAGVNAGNQRVTNVQAGRVERGSTDAVNGGQLWDAQQAWNDRWTDTDRRVRHQDRRINALGAQLGAMSQMATAAAQNGGTAVGQVNLNMGVGFSGGEAAVSIGWGARISERTSVSAGLSFGSGNKPVAGFGVSINLGR